MNEQAAPEAGKPNRQAWLQVPETTQNKTGAWVPAIPLPFYGLRKRCRCKRRFWTAGGYRGHYALAHILDLD